MVSFFVVLGEGVSEKREMRERWRMARMVASCVLFLGEGVSEEREMRERRRMARMVASCLLFWVRV